MTLVVLGTKTNHDRRAKELLDSRTVRPEVVYEYGPIASANRAAVVFLSFSCELATRQPALASWVRAGNTAVVVPAYKLTAVTAMQAGVIWTTGITTAIAVRGYSTRTRPAAVQAHWCALKGEFQIHRERMFQTVIIF